MTAIGAAAVIVVGLVAAVPASASGTATRGTASESVTILLKAPHQAGLDRLATAQGLSHAQRVAALTPLLPGAAVHRTVSDQLRNAGFTVTHQTAWTINATSSPATVTATFGAQPAVPSNASKIQRARAGGAFPQIPASISALTAAVLPTSGGPKLFTPRSTCGACRDGRSFRNAYTAPHVAPATGQNVNGPLTIATLQFAGWNEQDLTSYAQSVGLPDPVVSGQYKQIPVDSLTVPSASKNENEADEEVDLDQETLLSTDPTANQRAYFDTKANKAAYADALSQVLADVTQGTGAYQGVGDPKIAALSTSWGTCESEFSDAFAFPHDTTTAIENIMKSLTAAGVTVFAASGDNGVYDCGNYATSTKLAVDYPASSPEVVGVGGTRLKPVGSRSANTGANWTDTAWSCTSARVCQGMSANDTGGSGGGESLLFRKPSYQTAGIGNQPFTTSTHRTGNFGAKAHRLVPDLAVDGDPATGFGVVTSDPSDVPSCKPPIDVLTCKPRTFVIGGTSLSAPATAALFTDMLGQHAAVAGVGDIHAALYSAYAAHRGAFRDVRVGTNGRQQDVDTKAAEGRGYELPVKAQKGYDTITGLGAPLWPRIAPYLLAPVAGTATGRLALATPHSARHSKLVKATWGAASTARGASASTSASVTITRPGATTPIYHRANAPVSGATTFTGIAGGAYTLTVTTHNLARKHSAPITRRIVIPYDDRTFDLHGSWDRLAAPHDYGGSHLVSAHPGAFATVTVRARSYTLGVRTGPMYGRLDVFHGTTEIGSYDLHSRSPGHRLITFFTAPTMPAKYRTFRFRAGSTKPSSASLHIDIDALIR